MKIFVKTLKDTHFEIEVKPEDTVADVKKNIETVQGSNNCPAAKQMLLYQGNVLKDDTTLQDNKVNENSFIVIMLTKTKGLPGEGSSISAAPTTKVPISIPLAAPSPLPASASPSPLPAPTAEPAPAQTAAVSPNESGSGANGEVASNLPSVTNFDQLVQQILDVGGGTWDRDTVIRALRAAHNIPERAVEYMYILGAGLNTEGAGVLDFLRNSPQFQALRAIVQADPQMLQPMLQELGKQNPHVVRLIQEHQDEFRRLINEPIEAGERNNIRGQPVTAAPQAIQVTPAERDAIERLEVMGFDRATVLEVYFACNKNEELAANYLLDHLHELED